MAKPILIVRTPDSYESEDMYSITNKLEEHFNDYHILTIRTYKVDDIEFETLNAKDFTSINYKELKEYIKKLTS